MLASARSHVRIGSTAQLAKLGERLHHFFLQPTETRGTTGYGQNAHNHKAQARGGDLRPPGGTPRSFPGREDTLGKMTCDFCILTLPCRMMTHPSVRFAAMCLLSFAFLVTLAHQNRTIAISSDFCVDGAKSPEILQKKGVLGSDIAARNRKSLATVHRTLKSQCSIVFSCLGNRCDFWGPRWASQSQIAEIAAISVR